MIDRTVELMERLLMVALQNAMDLFIRMPIVCVQQDIKRNIVLENSCYTNESRVNHQ